MRIKQIYDNVASELKQDYPQDNFKPATIIVYIIIPFAAILHSFFFAWKNELVTGIVYAVILGLVFVPVLSNRKPYLPDYIIKYKLHSLMPAILIIAIITSYIYPSGFMISAPFVIMTLLVLILWLEGKALPTLFITSILCIPIFNLDALNTDLFIDAFKIIDSNNSQNIKYGIFGIAWQAMINTVYAFLLLTAALRMIRIDKLLNFVAFRATHGRRQGASAGLYTVIDSALYGSISGSAEDNVNKTGKYTIDLMRQSGYNHIFAASIEAVASSAGKVIPPVMGVVAFIILEVEPNISYIDLMVGSLIPAFLFLFALGVAIAIEANKQNLKPLDINYAQKELSFKNKTFDIHIQFLTWLLAGVILLLFAISLVPDLPLSAYPVAASIVIFIVSYFWSPHYRDASNKRHKYRYLIDFLKSLTQAGKDGVLLAISCAMIGLLLFVLEIIGLFDYATLLSQQTRELLINKAWFSNFAFESIKLFVLASTAFITLYLGKHLPAVAVYLLVALIAPHFLAIVGLEGLHAHLFLLYYAILSGLTPPFAPVLEQAAKAINKTTHELVSTTYKLASVMFILPIAWAYHPEIVLQLAKISNLNQDTFIIFNILSLMLAVMAVTVANFGYFRRELEANYYKYILWASAIILVSPLMILIKVLAFFTIVWILAKNDLKIGKYKNIKQEQQSFFRPAFELIKLVIKPKNIPVPTYFTFIILAIVYIGLFTINGFALNFERQIVKPLIQDRFQIMLGVEKCDEKTQNIVNQYFHDYNSSSLCAEFVTQASISKQEPAEFGLINDERQISIIGFKTSFFDLVDNFKSSLSEHFNIDILSMTGACFRYPNQAYDDKNKTFFSPLRDADFNLNKAIEHNCHQLPIVYVGKQLTDKINVATGTIIRIHERIYFENMHTLAQKMNQNNKHQFFVVGATFETGIHELDTAIFTSQTDLQRLGFDIEPRLLVKLDKIEHLNQISDIEINLYQNEILPQQIGMYDIHSFMNVSNGLIESISEAVSTLDAIQYSMLLVCLIVLVSAMVQLVESQARMIALMRMSGLHGIIIWLFLFLLSSLVVTLACVLGILSTSLIDITPLSHLIFGNIDYDINLLGFMQLYGMSLIFAVITTIFLKIQYFSHDIFRELMYASRRA